MTDRPDGELPAAHVEPPDPEATADPERSTPLEPSPSDPAAEPAPELPPPPEPAPVPPAPGPIAILTEGITATASNALVVRRASVYIGVLLAAMAGPAILFEIWVASIADTIDPHTHDGNALLADLGIREGLLILVALLGLVAITIEGNAIAIGLLAGRLEGRSIGLRRALERSRAVFWRLVRVGIIVGIVEALVGWLWRMIVPEEQVGPIPNLSVHPLAGAIAAYPFVLANVAVVLGDEPAWRAVKRSWRFVGGHARVGAALAAFTVLSGVLESFALGSGLDVIGRFFDAAHLDLSQGGVGGAVVLVLGLALATAAGSLVFTVGALVVSPQVVAWLRFGQPIPGLPEADRLPIEAAPIAVAEPAADAETSPDLSPDSHPSSLPDSPPSSPSDSTPEPQLASSPEPALVPTGLLPAPTAWTQAPAAPSRPPTYWASSADRRRPFRWVTIPMRLFIVAIWATAIAAILGGRSPVF